MHDCTAITPHMNMIITLYSITMACSRLAHTIEILYMYYIDLQQSNNYS